MKGIPRLVLGGLLIAMSASQAGAEFVTGSATGLFQNPTPPNTTFSGVGTAQFTWGAPGFFGTSPNRLSFEGASFDASEGAEFTLGRVTYYNAPTFVGTTPSSVDLILDLTLTGPVALVTTIEVRLGLFSTLNDSDEPDPDADFVVASTTPFTLFTVNGRDYTFELVGFDNVGGAGSLVGRDTLRLGEEMEMDADLVARVSTVAQVIPEPASIAMLGMGMSGVLFGWLRRRRIGRDDPRQSG